MQDSKKNKNVSLDQLSVKKRRQFTALIWLFTVLSYLFFGFGLYILFGVTFLPLVVAGLKKPEMFKILMFPKSLRRWVMESRIVIACRGPQDLSLAWGKLTWKQQIPGALLLSTLFPILIFIAFSEVLYTPVLSLDEMDVYEGYVEKAVYTTGRRGRSLLWLRTATGKKVKFVHAGTRGDINYLKELGPEDTIKVWSQNEWSIGPEIFKRTLRQLKHGDTCLKKYDKNRVLRVHSTLKIITYVILSYIVIVMSFLWLKGNNYIKNRR